MKPLNIALIIKGSASNYERSNRNMGYWSYPVEQFTWQHFYLGDPFRVERRRFRDFDLVFMEDGGNYGSFSGSGPPVVYLIIDSTLSDAHYKVRLEQAKHADLVLVDHDRLERFRSSGKPVRRLAYCVNDNVFKPLEKELDITFHCGTGARKGMPGGVERTALRQELDRITKDAGYSFRSGALGLQEYAANMGKSKVVVNWPRTPINRPHRVFDAMACGACLLTGELPQIPEDRLIEGWHYVEFEDGEELPLAFRILLDRQGWQKIAENGLRLVQQYHTWRVRARELREMLSKDLGL